MLRCVESGGRAQAAIANSSAVRSLLAVRMQTKVTLLFIFLGALPAGILGWLAVDSQMSAIQANIQMHRRFATLIKSEITRRIWGYRKLLTAVTLMPEMQRMVSADILTGLERLMASDQASEKGLEGLAVYDRARIAQVVVGASPPVRNLDQIFSDAFFDTYGGSASQVASSSAPLSLAEGFGPLGTDLARGPFVEDKDQGAQPQLRFLIYGPGKEVAGVLVASLSANYLSNSLNKILDEITEITSKVDIYVLDSRDHCIAVSRGAKYAKEPVINAEALRVSDPDMRDCVEEPLKSFYAPAWRLVVAPRPSAFEEQLKTKTTTAQIILVGILAAIVVGLMLTRSITTPLSELARSAYQIAQGKLDTPVPVTSSDEIGDLASAFESMRENLARSQATLKARIQELGTMCEVGKAISSTLDLGQLLHVILDFVMGLVGADRGSIMLFDEEKQELRIRVAKGLPPDIVEGTRLKRGDKVAGFVLETEKALLVADPENSPHFKWLKGTKIHPGSLICVPLIVKDKKLGVLNVSRKEPGTLDEKHKVLAVAISAQAAVAIENARLFEMAIKDELTKLFIRRYFDQRLREELRRARRNKALLSVLLLDVDHFKKFNDTYGHQCGDEVLIFLGRVMREQVRDVDIVCRYGGEEFAVLCPAASVEEALVPAERIRKAVEAATLDYGGMAVRCTVSIGLACYPRDAARQEDLLEASDQALYGAKHGGRNRVVCYRDLGKNGPVKG